MSTFPENVSVIYPVIIEPCLSDDDADMSSSRIELRAPDNTMFSQLVAPLSSEFYYCGVTRNEAGCDCNVILLSLARLMEHLTTLESSVLTENLRKNGKRWKKVKVEYLRLTFPVRLQNFGIEQQVWGHESKTVPASLQQRAVTLQNNHCDFCHCQSKLNVLIFRDNNPENTSDNNLGLACPVCVYGRHLNQLGANDGVMVYLPELAPEDISHLLRAVIIARKQGDERQKQGANLILQWLTSHRKETEAFWGSSHPGEFGHALMHASASTREDLQQRLRHIALIPNPEILGKHVDAVDTPTTTWLSLLDQYHSRN